MERVQQEQSKVRPLAGQGLVRRHQPAPHPPSCPPLRPGSKKPAQKRSEWGWGTGAVPYDAPCFAPCPSPTSGPTPTLSVPVGPAHGLAHGAEGEGATAAGRAGDQRAGAEGFRETVPGPAGTMVRVTCKGLLLRGLVGAPHKELHFSGMCFPGSPQVGGLCWISGFLPGLRPFLLSCFQSVSPWGWDDVTPECH